MSMCSERRLRRGLLISCLSNKLSTVDALEAKPSPRPPARRAHGVLQICEKHDTRYSRGFKRRTMRPFSRRWSESLLHTVYWALPFCWALPFATTGRARRGAERVTDSRRPCFVATDYRLVDSGNGGTCSSTQKAAVRVDRISGAVVAPQQYLPTSSKTASGVPARSTIRQRKLATNAGYFAGQS